MLLLNSALNAEICVCTSLDTAISSLRSSLISSSIFLICAASSLRLSCCCSRSSLPLAIQSVPCPPNTPLSTPLSVYAFTSASSCAITWFTRSIACCFTTTSSLTRFCATVIRSSCIAMLLSNWFCNAVICASCCAIVLLTLFQAPSRICSCCSIAFAKFVFAWPVSVLSNLAIFSLITFTLPVNRLIFSSRRSTCACACPAPLVCSTCALDKKPKIPMEVINISTTTAIVR